MEEDGQVKVREVPEKEVPEQEVQEEELPEKEVPDKEEELQEIEVPEKEEEEEELQEEELLEEEEVQEEKEAQTSEPVQKEKFPEKDVLDEYFQDEVVHAEDVQKSVRHNRGHNVVHSGECSSSIPSTSSGKPSLVQNLPRRVGSSDLTEKFSVKTLVELLQSTVAGKEILKRGQQRPLSNESQRELVAIVAEYHNTLGLAVKEEVLRDYGEAIVAQFRHESLVSTILGMILNQICLRIRA